MILTLEQLKQEVGRVDDYHDELLQLKLDQAEAIIIDYLKVASDFYGGTPNNDFPAVEAAAVLLVAKNLYESPEDPIDRAVKNILHRTRDPAIA